MEKWQENAAIRIELTTPKDKKEAQAWMEKLDKIAQEYYDIAQNITCEYCGICKKDHPDIPFHRDHIVPRRWGGADDPENMADSCAPCNYSKGDALNMKTLHGRVGMSYVLQFRNGLWHLPSRGL